MAKDSELIDGQRGVFESDSDDEKQTKLSAVVFTLLLAVPMLFTALYGGTDYWALGLQSVLVTLIMAMWVLDALLGGRFAVSGNPLQLPIIGLILIGVVQMLPLGGADTSGLAVSSGFSAARSLDPYATRLAVTQLLVYLLFFAAALVFVNSPKRLRISVAVVLVFTSLMAFFGILQFLAKPEAIYGLRPTPQAQPFSSFVNRHHFAALMVMMFGLALSILVGKGYAKDKRFLLGVVIFLSGVATVLTGSRGGLLSLFAVMAFTLAAHLLLRRKHRDIEHDRKTRGSIFARTLSLVFAFVAVAVLLVGAVVFLGGDSSLIRSFGLSSQEDFSSGRLHFWTVAFEVFKANPLIGAGLDAFAVAFTRHDTWPGVFRIEQAHNEYLHILAEAGVAGLLAVLGFIGLLFKRSVAGISQMTDFFPRSVAVGALAGCVGVMIHSFFDFPLRTPANAYFFLLMAVFATSSIRFHRGRSRRKHPPTLIDQY